jgi:hypothetical protein
MWSKTLSSWGRLLGLGRSGGPEEERRLWGRIACDVETTIQAASGEQGPSLPARVRNVSRGGINLSAGRKFEPGALLSVALPVGGGTEVLACVVRCDPLGAELNELGCTFAAQLSDEDMHSLGARKEKPAAPDQRGWVRYECQAVAAYQVVRAPDRAEAAATVLNVSASGIALQVEEALRVGELLTLELRRDGAVVLATLASVVRTATAPDGARVVGCNFIRELSDEQVLTLL